MSNALKTTERVFHIFETIARLGPVSLADLTQAVDLPRSAVHRSVQTLQRRGWVRARLYDHCYELSSKFDMFMANCQAALTEVEKIAPVMAEIATQGYHVDFGMFTRPGYFETLETTDRNILITTPQSLLSSMMVLVVLKNLEPAQQIRHIEAYLRYGSVIEAEAIKQGEASKILRDVPAEGSADNYYAHVFPKHFFTGSWGAVALRTKGKTRGISIKQIRSFRNLIQAET